MIYQKYVKRVLDMSISSVALVVLSPVFLLLTLLSLIILGRPIFFRQTRTGIDGELFTLLKFRTMTNDVNASGELLADEFRLVGYGSFLRATSLDETPQFLNVLLGDMSLIGPRPLLPEYLPLYSFEQLKRLVVKPGLSGLTQANGRNELTWDEKFKLDLQYVESISLKTDLLLIAKTIKSIMRISHFQETGKPNPTKFSG